MKETMILGKVKLQDFFNDLMPSYKASFITTCKGEYGYIMDEMYDEQRLIDILNEIQLKHPVKGAF